MIIDINKARRKRITDKLALKSWNIDPDSIANNQSKCRIYISEDTGEVKRLFGLTSDWLDGPTYDPSVNQDPLSLGCLPHNALDDPSIGESQIGAVVGIAITYLKATKTFSIFDRKQLIDGVQFIIVRSVKDRGIQESRLIAVPTEKFLSVKEVARLSRLIKQGE